MSRIITVLGMDPSLDNWGLAQGRLDLDTGFLTDVVLGIIQPKKLEGKQVRVNSKDLHRAEQLCAGVFPWAERAKMIFIECPVGSQSARAMASYGICVGVLGSIRAMGIPLIEVDASSSKLHLAGKNTASKADMIAAATRAYPDANWPLYKQNGKSLISESKAEHMADAIGAIHAGVLTPVFQNLLRLNQGT